MGGGDGGIRKELRQTFNERLKVLIGGARSLDCASDLTHDPPSATGFPPRNEDTSSNDRAIVALPSMLFAQDQRKRR